MISLLITLKMNKTPLILSEVNIVQFHNLMLVLELRSALRKNQTAVLLYKAWKNTVVMSEVGRAHIISMI